MKDTVLSLLPSHALREKIREVGYEFTEQELLFILYEYAPTFEERVTLLERFAETATPEIKKTVRLITAWQRRIFDAFRVLGEGEVYELHIKDTPDSYDETYLCGSYEAALAYIDLFYKEYGTDQKGDSTRTASRNAASTAESPTRPSPRTTWPNACWISTNGC